jgi:multicomponent Na+:H+ antiporter subunit E
MRLFLWNLLLSATWAFATGLFTPANLMVGFLLGYLVLVFVSRAVGPSAYFTKVPQVVRFVVFYLWQIVLSNLRVAHDVVTPGHRMRPGVIAIPLDVQTDNEITLLANLITLTPGSVSLDVSSDRRVLYVHVMYLDKDVETTRRRIKEGLERRVLEVLR